MHRATRTWNLYVGLSSGCVFVPEFVCWMLSKWWNPPSCSTHQVSSIPTASGILIPVILGSEMKWQKIIKQSVWVPTSVMIRAIVKNKFLKIRDGWVLAEWLERLTANPVVATVLGWIPASSDTVDSEGWQVKQCWRKKWKNPKNSPLKVTKNASKAKETLIELLRHLLLRIL